MFNYNLVTVEILEVVYYVFNSLKYCNSIVKSERFKNLIVVQEVSREYGITQLKILVCRSNEVSQNCLDNIVFLVKCPQTT